MESALESGDVVAMVEVKTVPDTDIAGFDFEDESVSAKNDTGGASAEDRDYAQQLRALYSAHNPSMLPEVPRLLQKYAGRERKFIDVVARKYGASAAPAAALSDITQSIPQDMQTINVTQVVDTPIIDSVR